MKWQPIETAPRDGTFVLLFDANGVDITAWPFYGKSLSVTIGAANTTGPLVSVKDGRAVEWLAIQSRAGDYVGDVENDAEAVFPTHWMPLPEPPASEGVE